GLDKAEHLEPRLLPSTAVDPATPHPHPATVLQAGRHMSLDHDQHGPVPALNHGPVPRPPHRIGHALARRPKAWTTPAFAPAPIDGARAYGYLVQICALGPRPAGSVANTLQRQLVARH